MRVLKAIAEWFPVTLGLIVSGACAPRYVAPSTAATSGPADNTITSSQDSWSPKISPGLYKYVIQDTSTITLSSDTTTHPVPITSIIFYSLTLAPVGELFTVTGMIDSSIIHAQSQSKSSPDSLHKAEFRTTVSAQNRIIIADQQNPACAHNENPAIARVFEVVTTYPRERAGVGDRWSDTVSTISCRGKTPLLQQTIREYELLELPLAGDLQSPVKVQQTLKMILSNLAQDSSSHLTVTGSGTGSAVLYLNHKNGTVIKATINTRAEFVITTSRGVFPFIQETQTHIRIQ